LRQNLADRLLTLWVHEGSVPVSNLATIAQQNPEGPAASM